MSRTVAKQSAVYAAGNLINKTALLFLLPLYTAYLSPDQFGIISIVNSLIAVLLVLFHQGTYSAFTRYYFQCDSDEDRKKLTGTIFLYNTVGGLLLFVLANLIMYWATPHLFKDVAYFPYICLGIAIVWFNNGGRIMSAILPLLERPVAFVMLSVGEFLAEITFIILLIVVYQLGAYGYLVGMLSGRALVFVIFNLWALRYMTLSFDFRLIKKAITYGFPLQLFAIGWWVINSSSRWFLEMFTSLEIVGQFSIAYTLGSAIILVVIGFNTAFTVRLFKRYDPEGEEESAKTVAGMATHYTMFIVLMSVLIAVTGHYIVELLTTAAYHDGAKIVPLVALGTTIYGLYIIPNKIMMLRERTRVLIAIIGIAGVVNVGLNIYLIPRIGMWGAAWAMVAAQTYVLAHTLVVSQRMMRVPYEWTRILRIFVIAAIVYVGVGAFPTMANAWLALLLKGAVVVGLYAFLLWALRVYSWHQLRSMCALNKALRS